MVRVAWMKNCGGKREGEPGGAPGRGKRGSGAWKKLDGARRRERRGNKSVSGVLAAQ